MSNIYIKEPSTNGKVVVHTSFGDIDIELWSKEAPLACRNFAQLCMEEYYNNVIFHRIVPGFIVQGGDPTGTGEGGESIYGKPFKDEFHQRLRFVRRGLVAMANAGSNDNGSQFFFTLGPCNDLNKKHTIFGKVTGDTVYNLVRLGEVDVDANERPLNPPCIKWTKVLASPFDDIEPRVDPAKKKIKEEGKQAKSQSRATKDYKLLSFGEEAEEDEEESATYSFKGPKSSHDLAKDPRLSATPISVPHMADDKEPGRKREASASDEEEHVASDDPEKDRRLRQVRDKLKTKKSKLDEEGKLGEKLEKEDKNESKADQMRKESRRIARELAGKNKNDVNQMDKSSSDSEVENISDSNPMFAEYKAQQRQYRDKTSGNKKKGSSREQQTMAMLNSFRTKMQEVQEAAGSDDSDDVAEDDDDDLSDKNWLHHRLKNSESVQRDAKDMNRDVNEDRYDITDPRNPINQRRRENDKNKMDRDGRGGSDRHRRSGGDDRRERHGGSHRPRHHRR